MQRVQVLSLIAGLVIGPLASANAQSCAAEALRPDDMSLTAEVAQLGVVDAGATGYGIHTNMRDGNKHVETVMAADYFADAKVWQLHGRRAWYFRTLDSTSRALPGWRMLLCGLVGLSAFTSEGSNGSEIYLGPSFGIGNNNSINMFLAPIVGVVGAGKELDPLVQLLAGLSFRGQNFIGAVETGHGVAPKGSQPFARFRFGLVLGSATPSTAPAR